MRMSRRMGVNSGKKSVVVSVHGTANEEITITNNITKKSVVVKDGDTVELKVGEYTVLGAKNTSQNALPNGRVVKVTKNTTKITSYPDGALYWYGIEVVPWSPATSISSYDEGSATEVTSSTPNYLQTYISKLTSAKADETISYYCDANSRWTTTNTVNTSGYNTIKFDYARVRFQGITDATHYLRIGYCSSPTYELTGNSYTSTADRTTYSISSPKTSVYIGHSAVCHLNGTALQGKYEGRLYAVWLDGKIQEEEDETVKEPTSSSQDGSTSGDTSGDLSGGDSSGIIDTKSISVTRDTYRYGTECVTKWGQAGDYSTENYFGQKQGSYNIALIPIGKFSFSGRSVKLRLQFFGYRSVQGSTRWAICTSDANKKNYEGKSGAVTDSTRIATGVASLDVFSTSSYETITFDFYTKSIPSDTDLYVYLWPSGSGQDGVSHITRNLKVQVFCE